MISPRGGCSGPSTVVFDSRLTEYNFGAQHPMSPIRVDLTMRLADSLGLVGSGAGQLRMVDAPIADDELIATVHDARLIEAVTRMGHQPGPGEEQLGLGTDDNPVFLGMHEAAAHVVGASYEAFRQVWSGESLHSANIVGGLHHAMRDRASGFCIYNDIAVGIQWLLDQGREEGRVRRCGRPPRRRRRADLLRRPAGADRLAARVRPVPVPRHRLPGGPRRTRGSGHRGQRGPPAGHQRRGMAARLPCRRTPTWCGSSRPTCWSPSTAATPTPTTRWPT